jgi:hypothetical protein
MLQPARLLRICAAAHGNVCLCCAAWLAKRVGLDEAFTCSAEQHRPTVHNSVLLAA